MQPEETQPLETESTALELVHQQSEFATRLHNNLMEFANDVISYRAEDIERYGHPGDTHVVIRAPRNWGAAILKAV